MIIKGVKQEKELRVFRPQPEELFPNWYVFRWGILGEEFYFCVDKELDFLYNEDEETLRVKEVFDLIKQDNFLFFFPSSTSCQWCMYQQRTWCELNQYVREVVVPKVPFEVEVKKLIEVPEAKVLVVNKPCRVEKVEVIEEVIQETGMKVKKFVDLPDRKIYKWGVGYDEWYIQINKELETMIYDGQLYIEGPFEIWRASNKNLIFVPVSSQSGSCCYLYQTQELQWEEKDKFGDKFYKREEILVPARTEAKITLIAKSESAHECLKMYVAGSQCKIEETEKVEEMVEE